MVSSGDFELLESLEKELATVAGKEGGNAKVRAQYLREVRRLQLRRSRLVAVHGVLLLNDASARTSLGKELWDVYEQVAVAAMDCHSLDVAKECIGSLMGKFPDSSRVSRLEGMWLEANGWWDQAERLYNDLLDSNPEDKHILKRKIALLISRGNKQAAATALTKYLDIYMADYEAWKELGDLYIELQAYRQAGFCFEELLLSAPANPIFNITYAEILYTLGGEANLRTALTHYAAAVEYSDGDNLRAVLGICMCAAAFESSGGKKGLEADVRELIRSAADTVRDEYRHKCPDKLPLVQPLLDKC